MGRADRMCIDMRSRPYVLLSVAASLDGYVDDASSERLVLSSPEDLDRVDDVRAGVDAILVGANTIRTDNPRLQVRSAGRRCRRVDAGKPPDPIKVTLTREGDLDPAYAFFTAGDSDKVVYTTSRNAAAVAVRLAEVADVVGVGTPVDPGAMLTDLADRGVERLMVEGGSQIHTMFLSRGLVDELQLVFAPFFVGSGDAPRLVDSGAFPQDAQHRMRLVETRAVGDCVLLRYLVGSDGS